MVFGAWSFHDITIIPINLLYKTKSGPGFTIIEVLISIAILAILAAIVYSAMFSFKDSSILLGEADKVFDMLTKAKTNTVSSKSDSSYGVRLSSTTVILFKGNSYAGGTIEETLQLRSPAQIYSLALASSSPDIVFERLTGETDNFGTITLRSVTNANMTKTITVYASGLVEIK